ncbi:DNA polymerase III subunit delta' [Paraburkholderia unamae]|uniref:DNA polymerase III delta prime subunit n=1 Tax=Paraburkholderia unamae TaxID=219649 RepID=A0ABX5KDJ4_9BURK|nr:DNA polymerase III subunit delta' [Paraburkholderia unamae]PVX72257.1 DNA polymerase III delta prime subunit [Paraburkholderia unamae]CAG9259213.1 DNA polymerase-3 subunit delta [Paraburkholderia unamae]
MIYPWQTDDWQRLQQLRSHWPHALLLHGQAGIGKLQFAQHLAKGLLCESPQANGEPCGACAACHWFEQGNHPDYRIVVPEALAGEIGPAGEDDAKAEKADKGEGEEGKKGRAPSKEIRIEQVRALLDFTSVGSHRGGLRVVVLYPAEALNVAAANALLKTLEEPPAGVVFLVVSARIDRLLPTIISRCRQWPMGTPAPEAATAWLAQQGVDDAPALLAESGGAPLAALALASDANRTLRDWTLAQLAAGPACDAFACGETLQKLPVPLVLGWLQRWVYDLLAERTAGRPRYFPQAGAGLARCAAKLDAAALARYMKTVTRQRAVENHPLNARLVFEELFLGYRELFA